MSDIELEHNHRGPDPIWGTWCPACEQLRAYAQRDRVLVAHVGDSVTAPRGDMPCIVATIFHDGTRLLTTDGVMVEGDWCDNDEHLSASGVGYYEYVSPGGRDKYPLAGLHGWYCSCHRIVQTG